MQRDLIEILKNILTQSGKSGQTIVQQNNVVETLFRDLLFKSYYHDLMGEEAKGAADDDQAISMSPMRLGITL